MPHIVAIQRQPVRWRGTPRTSSRSLIAISNAVFIEIADGK
jgi:hypothetical protein